VFALTLVFVLALGKPHSQLVNSNIVEEDGRKRGYVEGVGGDESF
jgi:hypothetical protein